jgi:hypothetical protein
VTFTCVRAACLALGLLLPSLSYAQPRDMPGSPAVGTARISGVVVTNDATPLPVRRAIVALSGGGLPLSRNAITDDNGRFELIDVPAGRFSIAASRAAYVPIAYGATRPGRPGTALVVEPGAALTDIRLQLARGAAITGTARDSSGEPAPGLSVRVERRDRTGARVLVGSALRTDDRGMFRAFGLASGDYIVSVTAPGATNSGLQAPTDADVDRELRALQQNAPGRTTGVSQPSSQAAEPPRMYNYAPVYHPDALSVDDATAITVAVGEERRGVDITVLMVSTSLVAGTVVAPGSSLPMSPAAIVTPGRPPSLPIEVTLRSSTSGQRVPGANATVGPDGTFRFQAIPPGRYMLTASAVSPALRPVAMGLPPREGVPDGGPCLFGTAEINPTGQDIVGLSIVLRPCLTLSARVAFDGTVTAAPADLSTVRVTLLQRGSNGFAPIPRRAIPLKADGTIELGDAGELLPGAYLFAVETPASSSGQGWWLRSAVVNGQDVLDSPLVVSDASPAVSTAVLTLADRHASLAGRLQTAAQRPAVDYTVIAFTTNRAWWTVPFRRVRTARPGTDGHFAFEGLVPGEYFLAALADIEPDEWLDSAFLGQLAAVSVRVTVAEGERKVQDFQIADGR